MHGRGRPEHGEDGRILARFRHQTIQPDFLLVERDLRPGLALVRRIHQIASLRVAVEVLHRRKNSAVVAHVEEVQLLQSLVPRDSRVGTDVHAVVPLQIRAQDAGGDDESGGGLAG